MKISSKIKFISSRRLVISSIYLLLYVIVSYVLYGGRKFVSHLCKSTIKAKLKIILGSKGAVTLCNLSRNLSRNDFILRIGVG